MSDRKNPVPGSRKVLTVPNALSLLRLCLLPLIVWLYAVRENTVMTIVVLVISGATDILDGWIARRFNMVSELGKALDPVADKLTQGVLILCLLQKFPQMFQPLEILIMREVINLITGVMVIRATGHVMGADWHGKLATVAVYVMMVLHFLWGDKLPVAVSSASIAVSELAMIVSLVLYSVRNIEAVHAAKARSGKDEKHEEP